MATHVVSCAPHDGDNDGGSGLAVVAVTTVPASGFPVKVPDETLNVAHAPRTLFTVDIVTVVPSATAVL